MGKRSARASRGAAFDSNICTMPASRWDPLEGNTGGGKRYVRNIQPKSPNQARLMSALQEYQMVLALGPAGTGKTYLAVAAAVEALEENKVERIVLSRPAVEAGESIGFLPGDANDKVAPYMQPLYDALLDRLGGKRLRALMSNGGIEIAPVAFMRGRTLSRSFVVIDEAQNCTYAQLKMLLTRLGWNATMVITGDPDQTDLLPELSGLADIANKLDPLENISVVRLEQTDIVRHPLVGDMLTVL
ncbi:MAG: phosphate starvation-inducible PhoH-like protein [Paracoccaceae bacterium]|jgi:phosphate starvation-inducible PhoH-like protein